MIKIIPYHEKYDEALCRISAVKLKELKLHGDVLKESRVLALDGSRCIGYGFLTCDGNYHEPVDKAYDGTCRPQDNTIDESRRVPVNTDTCFLTVDYRAVSERAETEVEASALLLTTLMDQFDQLSRGNPEKRLVLRTWCGIEKKELMEFLQSFEFQTASEMMVMVKDLQAEEAFSKRSGSGTDGIVLRADPLSSPEEQTKYLAARSRSFGTRESRQDLIYRLDDPDTRIFTASCEEAYAAGVTTWRRSLTAVSAEGVFCVPELRRRGIAESLMRFVHSELWKSGVRHVILTVYTDNKAALAFYSKLGYQARSLLKEMHYVTQ